MPSTIIQQFLFACRYVSVVDAIADGRRPNELHRDERRWPLGPDGTIFSSVLTVNVTSASAQSMFGQRSVTVAKINQRGVKKRPAHRWPGYLMRVSDS